MNKKIIIFFIVVFIAIIALMISFNIFPAFTPAQQEIPKKIDIGFTSPNISSSQPMYSFKDVTKRLKEITFENNNGSISNTSQDMHILYVSGKKMDESGEATSWVFAIRHGNLSSMVTYDKNGETVLDWPTVFTGQEIDLNQIVFPDELFRINKVLLSDQQNGSIDISRELVLADSNYTVTLTSEGKIQVLQFDAKLGALTSTE